jgi:predicted dehydrogenase
VVHAVTFNYRGNPLVQQAREMVARGEVGAVHHVHGAYLQDWLLTPSDYTWRLDKAIGGESSALGDIGSHWCDLAEHVTGQRIEAVLADLTTAVPRRLKPSASTQAFDTASAGTREPVTVTSEDLATVLLRFDGGARGVVTVGQVCAGHKNDLSLEVHGATASLRWEQERADTLWVGRRETPSGVIVKDPALLHDAARAYVRLPGGHQQGWSDAFFNVMRDIYEVVAGRGGARPPAFATFEDGCRSARLIEAMLESHKGGGVWTRVAAPQMAGGTR